MLALDIGGTYIRIARINKNKISGRIKVSTPRNRKEFLNKIEKLIDKFDEKDKICLSVAGFVNNGNIVRTPHLPITGLDLKNWIKNRFNCSVYIENDAKCAAIAENKFGSGKKYKNYVFLTLGTGIGGAIFINGKLYRGKGFAGEFGHMLIKGKEFEKLASGKAFERDKKRHSDALRRISKKLALGISTIIYSFDPEAIILGGGFAEEKRIYKIIVKELSKIDIIHRKIPVIHAKLGENAGLIGASLLTKENY